MSEFQSYLWLGFQHIADPHAYDHILFVIALCAIYRPRDWKRILILITAFTIGHSITLALATLKMITYSKNLIELLIPITILLTCFLNFFHKSQEIYSVKEKPSVLRYPMAMVFGFIHGMGFSNFLRSMLGQEADIWQPLLAFNLGLEVGQILIVLIIMAIAFIVLEIFRVKKNTWNLILSGMAAGVALVLIKDAAFWG
jgi:hypothetical protein